MKDKQQKPKRRRKALWIILTILFVLIAGLVALWIWQKNNIQAVILYTQYTQEELEQQIEDSDKQFQEMLEEALNNAAKVDEENVAQEPGEETEPAVQPEMDVTQEEIQSAPRAPTYQEQLQAIIDRAYALRDSYVGQLAGLETEARKEYGAIPADQRTKTRLVEFASGYISKASNMEKDCDKQMDAIIADLEDLQKRYGQSLELVEEVKYTYANEKSLKKAWYMAELESRGMV